MKREDRLSAGMTPQKVSEVYAILKARFEESRTPQCLQKKI